MGMGLFGGSVYSRKLHHLVVYGLRAPSAAPSATLDARNR